jgi:hypothetical protein
MALRVTAHGPMLERNSSAEIPFDLMPRLHVDAST